MPITLVRIDDRLIHGQVIESWVPLLGANAIIVVSDAAATDATQRDLMALAIPEGIELSVLPVAEATVVLCGGSTKKNVLILAPSPKEVLALLKGGVKFPQVNVGGLHYSAWRVQLGKVVYIDEEDRAAFRGILKYAVTLEGRGVPSDEKMDMTQLLA